MPAAIAMGAVLLAGVGVIIGLLVQQNHVTSPMPVTMTGNAARSPGSYPAQLPTHGGIGPATGAALHGFTTARTGVTRAPPADQRPQHQCQPPELRLRVVAHRGFRLGQPRRAGNTGDVVLFAGSVLKSYWNQYGNVSRQLRRVSALGAVDCGTVDGAVCPGSNFLIQCAAYGSDNWITCTGGKNARVNLY